MTVSSLTRTFLDPKSSKSYYNNKPRESASSRRICCCRMRKNKVNRKNSLHSRSGMSRTWNNGPGSQNLSAANQILHCLAIKVHNLRRLWSQLRDIIPLNTCQKKSWNKKDQTRLNAKELKAYLKKSETRNNPIFKSRICETGFRLHSKKRDCFHVIPTQKRKSKRQNRFLKSS